MAGSLGDEIGALHGTKRCTPLLPCALVLPCVGVGHANVPLQPLQGRYTIMRHERMMCATEPTTPRGLMSVAS